MDSSYNMHMRARHERAIYMGELLGSAILWVMSLFSRKSK